MTGYRELALAPLGSRPAGLFFCPLSGDAAGMTDTHDDTLAELHRRIALMEVHVAGLEAENAALKRHNHELREAVAELLAPDKPSQVSQNPGLSTTVTPNLLIRPN
jgi:hypothetical protein